MTHRLPIFGFLASLAIILFPAANAQEASRNLIVVGDDQGSCEFLLEEMPSLAIDPQSGDVTAFVESLESCTGAGAAAALFLDTDEVASESSFQVFWASNAEDGCVASSAPSLTEWSGGISGEGQQSLTAPSVSSDTQYTLSIDCDGAEAARQLTVLELPPEPVEITSFTFNGNDASNGISLGEGEDLTVDWNSANATSCQASGTLSGWSGAVGTSGPAGPFTVSENATAGISCSNSESSRSAGPFDISVVSGQCADREQLPSDWVRKTTGSNSCIWTRFSLDGSKDCRFFNETWPEDWPGTTNSRNLTMGPGNGGKEYVAWQFNSGDISPTRRGQIALEIPQFDHAVSARKIWTFSKCPGDFNKEIIEEEMGPGCYQPDQFGSLTTVYWGGTEEADSSRCGLEPNQTYYLNVIYTDSDPGTAPSDLQPHPSCDGGRCGNNLAPTS